MSATSRRVFLAGAAAATAAYATGRGSETQAASESQLATNANHDAHAQPGLAQPQPVKQPVSPAIGFNVDQRVAESFVRLPRFMDPDLDKQPHSTVLLYGLVCVDFEDDFQELLLPNTDGFAPADEIHPHQGRFWCAHDIETGTADGQVSLIGRTLSFWDLKRKALTIEALDGTGAVVATTSPNLKWRNSESHPWTHQKSVRCIKDLIKGGMIEEEDRNSPARVAGRVKLTKGTITAVPPFNPLGRDVEWIVKKANGTEEVRATTDAMVWQRVYASPVTSFRFRLRPLPVGIERVVTVKPDKGSLVAVVTHAMPMATGAVPPNPLNLTDTKAFAQLVKNAKVSDYPVAKAHRNHPSVPQASGSDGHCECGCA